jgi:peptidoglycan/LPS O-acetylase OafA/YrhL
LGWSSAQRMLTWRPFIELGRQSFGLYLTNMIIIYSFSSYLFLALKQSHGYRTSFLVMFLPSLMLIFAVSYLFARWVDQPSIGFAKRLARASGREPAVPGPPIAPNPEGSAMPTAPAPGVGAIS